MLNPDSYLKYDSGGDPSQITSLDYQEFLDYYTQHYCLNNAAIVIVSQNDDQDELDYISEILQKARIGQNMNQIIYDSNSKVIEQTFADAYQTEEQLSILYIQTKLFNYVTDDNDYQTLILMNIIDYMLFQSPASPVVQYYLKSSQCSSFESTLDDSQQQIYLNFKFSGVDTDIAPNILGNFINLVKTTIENGYITLQLINSVVERIKLEKNLIQDDYNIDIVENIFASTLYGLDACHRLRDHQTYSFIETSQDLICNFLAELISQYVISGQYCQVILEPQSDYLKEREDFQKQGLQVLLNQMSCFEQNKILLLDTDVEQRQRKIDPKHFVDQLPVLPITQCKKLILDLDGLKGIEEKGFFFYETNDDVIRVSMLFDITNYLKDIVVVGVLINLLSELPTSDYSLLELQQQQDRLTTGINIDFIDGVLGGQRRYFIEASFIALPQNFDAAVLLLYSIVQGTQFTYDEHSCGKITEILDDLDQGMLGDSVYEYIKTRSKAQTNIIHAIQDQLSGYNFYLSLKQIVNKQEIPQLLEKCMMISNSLQSQFIAFAGKKLHFEQIKNSSSYKLHSLNTISSDQNNLMSVSQVNFQIPQQVNYVAVTFQTTKYHAEVILLNKILETQFLWDEVRVMGGAYGVSIELNSELQITISSFRDSNVQNTLDAFTRIQMFVQQLQLTDDQLNNFKIAAIGQRQTTQSTQSRFSRAFSLFLDGISVEEYIERMNIVYSTSLQDLRELAYLFDMYPVRPVIALGIGELEDESDE